jgi:hypothetical protein
VIASVVLAVLAVAGGALASYWYDDDASFTTRLAYGSATGLAALALVGFVLANLVGLPAATYLTGAILAGLAVAAVARPGGRVLVRADLLATRRDLVAAVRRPSLATTGPIAYTLVAVLFVWLIFAKVILLDNGALATGYVNNLGDLPFHLQVTSSFAFGQNFPPEDPTYAGTGFAYPYLSDLLAAMFVGLGASLSNAFLLENVLLGLALIGLLQRFTRIVTGDRLASYIAPVLVLLSGGLGWVLLIQDARTGEHGLMAVLGAMTRDYSIGGEPILRWGNAITTLLVTQRSLLFGLPVAVLVFILLWKLIHLDMARPGRIGARATALAAGLLTGALPLIHAHSFVVTIGTAFFLGLLFQQWRERRWLPWSIYVVAALALALPQIWWSTHDSIANAGTFFGFEIGWDHGTENPIWFWFVNTGLFIPLAVAAYAWPRRSSPASRSLLLFTTAFVAWFIVPNVMKLAPWVWDNIKVLFYWFVGFVPLVALLLARWLKGRPSWRVAGAGALVALTLAGGLDVWHVLSGQTSYQEFDRDGIAIAEAIRSETPPRALVLHAPDYNPAVFLTGRRSLLGYTGYIWAHGLPYTDREADIRHIYAGDDGALQLIGRYGIDYILVSPLERAYQKAAGLAVNDAFFDQFTKVDQIGEYTLYEVAKP